MLSSVVAFQPFPDPNSMDRLVRNAEWDVSQNVDAINRPREIITLADEAVHPATGLWVPNNRCKCQTKWFWKSNHNLTEPWHARSQYGARMRSVSGEGQNEPEGGGEIPMVHELSPQRGEDLFLVGLVLIPM
jgi:hypothetical protein